MKNFILVTEFIVVLLVLCFALYWIVKSLLLCDLDFFNFFRVKVLKSLGTAVC